MINIKTKQELALMREAGKIVARVLQEMEENARPGVATGQLNKKAESLIRREGGEPAFLGYHGFPASICVSINEELVHGIPGVRRLQEGDIVSIDVGVYYRGFCGDAARTFPVGSISPEASRLLEVTNQSLQKAIEQVHSGNFLSDVSHAVQSYVEAQNFAVVRNYVGHGIGRNMHEEPQVPNFGPPGKGPRLQEGMTLAIEPMVNQGTWEVEVLEDDWTVVTADRFLCAHFENTVAVTENGPDVLTVL